MRASPLVVGDIDVRPHAVPQHRLRARSERRTARSCGSTSRNRIPTVIPVMCCDTVVPRPRLRRRQRSITAPGRHHAGRARRQDRQGEVEGRQRRSEEGRDQHRHRAAGEGQGHRRHFRRRVRRARSRHRLRRQDRQAGVARLLAGPDNEMLFDPDKTMSLGKPVGKDPSLKTWHGDQWKIGGGTHLGLVSPTIRRLNLFFYGIGQSLDLEPGAARRTDDNQMVDDDLRARRRHRHGASGSTR